MKKYTNLLFIFISIILSFISVISVNYGYNISQKSSASNLQTANSHLNTNSIILLINLEDENLYSNNLQLKKLKKLHQFNYSSGNSIAAAKEFIQTITESIKKNNIYTKSNILSLRLQHDINTRAP